MARRKLPKDIKKQNLTPVWIILAVVVFVVGALVYQGVRELSGNPILSSQDDVPRMTVEEVRDAVENHGAVLLDVRTEGQFAASHITGAISTPVTDLDAYVSGLDKDAWYITYCT